MNSKYCGEEDFEREEFVKIIRLDVSTISELTVSSKFIFWIDFMHMRLLTKKLRALVLTVVLMAGGWLGFAAPTQASPAQTAQTLSVMAQATVAQPWLNLMSGPIALPTAAASVLVADVDIEGSEDDEATAKAEKEKLKAEKKAEKQRLKAEKKAAKAEAKRLEKIKEAEEEAAEDELKAAEKAAKKAAKEAKKQAKAAAETATDVLTGSDD